MSQQTTTTNRGPRGWDRLVTQLNAVSDIGEFHRGMLDLQCKIVAAEYGALWMLDQGGEPRAVEAWPDQFAKAPPDSPLMGVLRQAAKQGFEKNVSHVLKLEAEGVDGGTEVGAHVFVTVLRVKNKVVGLTTVAAELRDAGVLQSTAPLRELAAGLYEGFAARQEAIQKEIDTQRIRQALALLAVSQEAEGFDGSALNLVNELARQLKCSRVSLGWIKGRDIRLIAMSDTEHLKRHSQDVSAIELAMAECLDQQQPIVFPIPDTAEPLLQQAVVHAHKQVTNAQPGRHVLSLPLRRRDEWIGVLTLERSDVFFDPSLVQFLQLIADVIAPHLDDRRESDRWLVGHVWRSVEKTAGYLVGPKHVAWKLGALAAIAVIAVIVFAKWDYKVTAPFVFEAPTRRTVPAPFEGRVEAVFVRDGDHVTKGQELARLDTNELKLRYLEAQKEATLAALERSQKKSEYKEAEALQAESKEQAARARMELLDYQIQNATVIAPVDGAVIKSGWHDKVGGRIKQGEELFDIAPKDELIALIHVPDTDITQIMSNAGQTGRLTTQSKPGTVFEFVTQRVVPAAGPIDGVNSFEVRAKLNPLNDEERNDLHLLRPGMKGLAKIDAGRRPLYWVLFHRISDTVRLWTWGWIN
ncbi:MAG: HlyD family efflux transporter periplasmic adaptor subunit [Phycisphaeraceae bacterium]|nr:HlyD family efflux transporter periplasmic adaptor subunit [Phycisphaeraceae bacterium]